MQLSLDKFSHASHEFGFAISTKKSEVMFQAGPRKDCTDPLVAIKSEKRKVVDKFTYLSWTLSRYVCAIVKGSSAFGQLTKKLWERSGLSSHEDFSKLRLFLVKKKRLLKYNLIFVQNASLYPCATIFLYYNKFLFFSCFLKGKVF